MIHDTFRIVFCREDVWKTSGVCKIYYFGSAVLSLPGLIPGLADPCANKIGLQVRTQELLTHVRGEISPVRGRCTTGVQRDALPLAKRKRARSTGKQGTYGAQDSGCGQSDQTGGFQASDMVLIAVVRTTGNVTRSWYAALRELRQNLERPDPVHLNHY